MFKSIEDQKNVEHTINELNVDLDKCFNENFDHHSHYHFVLQKMVQLPKSYQKLSASRTWICFWSLHSLELMGRVVSESNATDIIQLLEKCQNPVTGGFGGGPYQDAHVASTYAAVSSIAILGKNYPQAFSIIDREKCVQFIKNCICTQDGSMKTSIDGEIDLRAIYCSLVTLKLLNALDYSWFDKTANYIASCQTYEGGFAAVPGAEAHAGYTFCGFASLILLDRTNLVDCSRLLCWASHRQMTLEGGFQGRTHKLVDSCYSYWVAALFSMIIQSKNWQAFTDFDVIFSRKSLCHYVVGYCQFLTQTNVNTDFAADSGAPFNLKFYTSKFGTDCDSGGLVDKPGLYPDLYHTCYALSGLSLAQPCIEENDAGGKLANDDKKSVEDSNDDFFKPITCLVKINALFNLTWESISSMAGYFC